MGLLQLALLTTVLLMAGRLVFLFSLPAGELSDPDPEFNRTLSEPVVLW